MSELLMIFTNSVVAPSGGAVLLFLANVAIWSAIALSCGTASGIVGFMFVLYALLKRRVAKDEIVARPPMVAYA